MSTTVSRPAAAPEAVAFPAIMAEETSQPNSPNPLAATTRTARALIGWLPPEETALYLMGRSRDKPPTQEMIDRATQARARVAARDPGVDQQDAVTPSPAVLEPHIAALEATSVGVRMRREGWSVALVDLRRLCSFQPVVSTEYAEDRAAVVDPDDVASIAAVSLPLPTKQPLSLTADAARQQLMCGSKNPNLRIVGQFHQPLEEGIIGVGFAVALLPSFLSVARFQGRLFLHDGYHRAYGFLRRGIHVVPAFVRDFGPHEPMNVPLGMLSHHEYMGDRPPMLLDFHDDDVAANVTIPATGKLIVVQGLELQPPG